jgi:hypothetical protein
MNSSCNSLTEEWQRLISTLYPGHQKPLTFEDRKRLKKLGDDIGEHAIEIVGHTLNNWPNFALKAMYSAGLNGFPTTPRIGFLQVHQKQAVDMYHKSLQPKPAPTPPVTADANRDSEQKARRMRQLERTADGRRKYNDSDEEICYPSDAQMAEMLARLS